MTFRNRKLLDISHDMPCMVEDTHECNAFNGCVPMHSDSSIFGRGGWHKSHDFAWAAGCPNAHALITATTMDRDTKFYFWLRAYVKTWEWMWENEKVRLA